MFNIINYSHKMEKLEEFPSSITFKCPVCSGKLKVNKNTKAYACYTNNCTSQEIRNKLGVPLRSYEDKFKKYNHVVINPVKFKNINVDNIIRVENYQLANKDKNKTTYVYNDNCIVERIDKQNRTKDLFPKYKIDDVWKYGMSDNFGFFNEEKLKDKKGIILIAEGEKTADYCSYYSGYLTLSPPGFGWNEQWLMKNIHRLFCNITGVLYLPDNDQVGFNKAKLVEQACWKNCKPCKILNVPKFSVSTGDDIADLVETYIIKNLINDLICLEEFKYG